VTPEEEALRRRIADLSADLERVQGAREADQAVAADDVARLVEQNVRLGQVAPDPARAQFLFLVAVAWTATTVVATAAATWGAWWLTAILSLPLLAVLLSLVARGWRDPEPDVPALPPSGAVLDLLAADLTVEIDALVERAERLATQGDDAAPR
jgi:hypothetical protein